MSVITSPLLSRAFLGSQVQTKDLLCAKPQNVVLTHTHTLCLCLLLVKPPPPLLFTPLPSKLLALLCAHSKVYHHNQQHRSKVIPLRMLHEVKA